GGEWGGSQRGDDPSGADRPAPPRGGRAQRRRPGGAAAASHRGPELCPDRRGARSTARDRAGPGAPGPGQAAEASGRDGSGAEVREESDERRATQPPRGSGAALPSVAGWLDGSVARLWVATPSEDD